MATLTVCYTMDGLQKLVSSARSAWRMHTVSALRLALVSFLLSA